MSFESKNPTTGKLLNIYPEHSAHDVEPRLQSAWDGWKKWSNTPLPQRTAFLLRLADVSSVLEKWAFGTGHRPQSAPSSADWCIGGNPEEKLQIPTLRSGRDDN